MSEFRKKVIFFVETRCLYVLIDLKLSHSFFQEEKDKLNEL